MAQSFRDLLMSQPDTNFLTPQDVSSALVAQPIQQAQPTGNFSGDFASGYMDNYKNGINTATWGNNPNATFANRLGEGLGSVARFGDSPAGRALLAGVLTSLGGGNRADVIKEAASAYVGRQNAQTADKLYRNQLKQYGYTDDDLNKIGGDITTDMYKNLSTNLYKTRKLTSDEATRQMNWVRQAQQAGQIDNATADRMLSQISSNIDLTNAGFKDSNQTLNTASQVNYREGQLEATQEKIRQADERIAIARQQLAINGQNAAARQLLVQSQAAKNAALIEQTNLLNEMIKKQTGASGVTVQTPTGTTINTGGDKVRVMAPNGKVGTIPASNLQKALQQGYKQL